MICDNETYVNDHTLQIITKARTLADIDGRKVEVLCIGEYDESELKKCITYGADTVIISRQSSDISFESCSNIAAEVIKNGQPEIVLFPASPYGKYMAAILSTRFESGLTAECIDIEIAPNGKVYFSRAAMNDSVIAKIECINCSIKMCTVKKDVFKKEEYQADFNGTVRNITYESGIKYVKDFYEVLSCKCQEIKEDIDINQYPIVFCIGRGVRSLELRNEIFKLAEKFGACVIGTRAAVEAGIINQERQVGQSGKSVAPRVYVGFGVSGATQHIVGIKNAETIIAINSDENAPIFNYADYTIVDSVENILAEINQFN